jgi:hypothetical protein
MNSEILFADIPQPILEDIRQGLQAYFLPLLVLSREDDARPAGLAGSGTLVEISSTHYILTADHVWNEARRWPELALLLAPEGGTPLAIPTDGIAVKRLRGLQYTAWGPDLALLELPSQVVGTIQGRKSFLNLERRRSMLATNPPKTDKALWAIVGTVGERSTITHHPQQRMATADIQAKAFFAGG